MNKKFFVSVWEDMKAWRRGDRRTGPRGGRGHIYERREPDLESPSGIKRKAKASGTASLSMTITRANGDIEHVNLSDVLITP